MGVSRFDISVKRGADANDDQARNGESGQTGGYSIVGK